MIWLSFLPSSYASLILIDPGHGGSDRGAQHNNIVEAQLVLKIGLKLQKKLIEKGAHKAELTRDKDQDLSLEDRMIFVEKLNPDLLVSLHGNANDDPRHKGMEVYIANSLPPDPDSLLAAQIENQNLKNKNSDDKSKSDFSRLGDVRSIVEDLKMQGLQKSSLQLGLELYRSLKSSGFYKVHVKQAPFYVLTHSQRPSILFEVGFLTHAEEARALQSEKYQNQITEKIFHAIENYLDKKDLQRID